MVLSSFKQSISCRKWSHTIHGSLLPPSKHMSFHLHIRIIFPKKEYHKCGFNTHLPLLKPPPRLPSLSLMPPLRCKRPCCLFEGLPRHISTANLACYARATVARSSSFIVVTHKARPKHKCLSATETPWMRESVSLYHGEKRNVFTLIGCRSTLGPFWWSSLERLRPCVWRTNHFKGCGKWIAVPNYSSSFPSRLPFLINRAT